MANVYDIIIRPVITERSMAATSEKKYVFEVAPTTMESVRVVGCVVYVFSGKEC